MIYRIILENGKVLPNEFVSLAHAFRFITLNGLTAQVKLVKGE